MSAQSARSRSVEEEADAKEQEDRELEQIQKRQAAAVHKTKDRFVSPIAVAGLFSAANAFTRARHSTNQAHMKASGLLAESEEHTQAIDKPTRRVVDAKKRRRTDKPLKLAELDLGPRYDPHEEGALPHLVEDGVHGHDGIEVGLPRI